MVCLRVPCVAKKIGWRDIFHVAVSWQRYVLLLVHQYSVAVYRSNCLHYGVVKSVCEISIWKLVIVKVNAEQVRNKWY